MTCTHCAELRSRLESSGAALYCAETQVRIFTDAAGSTEVALRGALMRLESAEREITRLKIRLAERRAPLELGTLK